MTDQASSTPPSSGTPTPPATVTVTTVAPPSINMPTSTHTLTHNHAPSSQPTSATAVGVSVAVGSSPISTPPTVVTMQSPMPVPTPSPTPTPTVTATAAPSPNHAATAAATIRSPQGLQQVQVIQQPLHNSPYMQQQIFQQQLMLQNAAVQAAMQAQGINPQNLNLVQNRTAGVAQGPKSPAMMSPPVGTQAGNQYSSTGRTVGAKQKQAGRGIKILQAVPLKAHTTSATGTTMIQTTSASKGNITVNSKGITATVPQQHAAAPLIGGKPVLQRQGSQPQPLVIGQLGVLSNQPVSTQTLLNTTRSPTFSIAQTQPQMISSFSNPTQIRLSSQPTLVTNTGQIIGTGQPTMIANQAVINHLQAMASLQQNIPVGHQPIFATQSGTILGSQPVYIRAAGPLQPQQGIMGNVQAVAPAKGKQTVEVPANIQIKPAGTQKVNAGNQTSKGTSPILPANQRMLNQAGVHVSQIQEKLAQVHPTNLSVQAINAQRHPLANQKQVNRVKGLKSQSKPSSPVPTNQSRIAAYINNPPKAGLLSSVQPPTMLVSPKVQQPQPQAQPPQSKQDDFKMLVTSKPDSTSVSSSSVNTNSPKDSTGSIITNGPSPTSNGGTPTMNGELTPKETSPPPADQADEVKQEDPPMEVDQDDEGNKDGTAMAAGTEKQRAVVRPQVLTHIIEGFVIQEGSHPFPASNLPQVPRCVLTEFINSKPVSPSPGEEKEEQEKVPVKVEQPPPAPEKPKEKIEKDKRKKEHSEDLPKLKCEFCGKQDFAHKFRRSKRFCSMACAKRYNVGCSRRLGLFQSQNPNKYPKKKKVPTATLR